MSLTKFRFTLNMAYRSALLLVILILVHSCQEALPNAEKPSDFFFESDLETVISSENKDAFTTTDSNYVLLNAEGISTDYARSGNHSIRLDSIHPYGLTCTIDDLGQNKFVSLSVWMHQLSIEGYLQVSINTARGEKVHRSIRDTASANNDWEQQTVSFMITDEMESISFCVFSGKKLAYFDDFSIHFSSTLPNNKLNSNLDLFIPDSAKKTLEGYMEKAMSSNIIPPDCKKYVSGFIINDGDSAAIDLKLKGDWTDHLPSGKESYRIKITDEFAYNGLKNFSIQHPKARNYLNEWLVHKMADREDVLTTTYDFINVNINGDFRGVYALEEHFDKQLLESRARREGPILKFDESAYWAGIEVFNNVDSLSQLPYFEQSPIAPFKKNRTRKSPQLSKQFADASTLLSLFKHGYEDVEAIFDIDQLARFYALMEIAGGWHAMRWHNRRFYFNPVTQKLEHIAYDILPLGIPGHFENSFTRKLKASPKIWERSFDNMLLYSEKFKDLYFNHLERMTEKSYLDAVFSDLESDLEMYLGAIQGEMSYYQFDRNVFYQNAAFLKSQIPSLKSLWTEKIRDKKYQEWIKPVTYKERKDSLFIKAFSINAYAKSQNSYYETFLENYHLNDIQIIGYQIKQTQKEDVWLAEPLTLVGFKSMADTLTLETTFAPRKIYFKAMQASGDTISKKVMPWAKPNGVSTRMALEAEFDAKNSIFEINSNQIIFKQDVVIDKLIAIPNQYTVSILPGTKIEFTNGGGLIVSNNFSAKGTENQPIHIFCKDSSSNGLTILQGENAVFEYVNIEGLSNLNHQNWELTGAVTIYETSTFIKNCTIFSSTAEDALNIIRSKINLDGLTLSKTTSDGLDLDFCQGLINNSRFAHTGNDCFDISGSEIILSNTEISNAGDKGISAGEASQLTLENTSVSNVEIGIAAKDASLVFGNKINVNNAKVAFTAFQKKPEYSGATIELTDVIVGQIKHETIIQKGSVITLNGKETKGNMILDIESAYARFQ